MTLFQSTLARLGIRPLSVVDTVIIHHTVAPKTDDATQISEMDINSQNMVTGGYHVYTKCLDVAKDLWACQMIRPIWAIPAAAYGMNLNSYDIAIGGNYHPGGAPFLDEVSEHSLKVVVAQILLAKKKLPHLKYLMGHRDVATLKGKQGLNPGDYSTACPGDRLYARLHDLRLLTGLAQHPNL